MLKEEYVTTDYDENEVVSYGSLALPQIGVEIEATEFLTDSHFQMPFQSVRLQHDFIQND